MKWKFALSFVVLCLLAAVLVSRVHAETLVPGTVADGYTFGSDGFWWYHANAYTRVLRTKPGYWYYGYYYQPSTYYEYTYDHSSYVPAVKKAPANWKEIIAETAKDKKEYEAFLLALKAAGLDGTSIYPGYVGSQVYSNPNLGSYGANANTLYGYSYQQVASLYGSTDINTLFQQSAKLAQGAQQLAGDANSQFNDRLGQVIDGNSRFAETLAKGIAAANALKSAELAPGATVITSGQGGGSSQGAGDNPPPVAAPKEDTAFLQVRQQACMVCHSGKDPKGGLDLTSYSKLSEEKRAEVLRRIMLPLEHKDHMPPKDKPQLTVEFKKLFVR